MPYRSPSLFIFNPVVRTRGIAEFMTDYIVDWLDQNELPDEQILFHYTDENGLKGILENRSLWFGHYSSFNDASEINYGKELVISIIDEFKDDNNDDQIRQFLESLEVTVKGFCTTMQHAYITCFCESGNLLSQWREYANKGGGYCLGFNFTENTYINDKGDELDTVHQPILRKVIYDKSEQEELVRNLLDLSIETLRESFDDINPDDRGHISAITGSDIGNLMVDLIITFKHQAFTGEEEWRLIRIIDKDYQSEKLSFRGNNGFLIPFRKTHIHTELDEELIFPVNSLRFGPTLEKKRSNYSLELFLNHLTSTNEENEIKISGDINIAESKIKLRA